MKRQFVPVLGLAAGGTTAKKQAPPTGAIYLVGVIYNPTTNPTYPVLINQSTILSEASSTRPVCRFMGSSQNKASYGVLRVNPDEVLNTSLTYVTAQSGSPAEGGIANVFLEFLVLSNQNEVPIDLPNIPFRCQNADESEEMTVTQTSAAATAQTIDLKPVADVEYEVTQAWFYAGGSISALLQVFDSTTAVTIVAPAAGTSGDLTPATRRALTGQAAGPMFRVSLPSAGVGQTSTGYISVRATAKS